MLGTLTMLFVRTPLLMWFFRADERRLSETQLERAWNPATRDLSTVILAELAPLVHFVKTRGWLRGLALGALYTVLFSAASTAVLAGEEWLFGNT